MKLKIKIINIREKTAVQFKPKNKAYHQVKGMTLGAFSKNSRPAHSSRPKSSIDSSLPAIAENVTKTLSNKNTLEKFASRSFRNDDFSRTGLVKDATSYYRVSRVNKLMLLCKSYPLTSIQPVVISDPMIKEWIFDKKTSQFYGIFVLIFLIKLTIFVDKRIRLKL